MKVYHGFPRSYDKCRASGHTPLRTARFSNKKQRNWYSDRRSYPGRWSSLFYKSPHRLWSPPSPLFNGYRGSSPGVKWPGASS